MLYKNVFVKKIASEMQSNWFGIGQCHIPAPNSTTRFVAKFTLSVRLCLVSCTNSESPRGP
jgi:hypothetical protein